MKLGLSLFFAFAATLGLPLCLSPMSPAAAETICMQADTPDEMAGGLLQKRSFKDAADRPETAYILTLPVPTCLKGKAEEDNVKSSQTVQLLFLGRQGQSEHRALRRQAGHGDRPRLRRHHGAPSRARS